MIGATAAAVDDMVAIYAPNGDVHRQRGIHLPDTLYGGFSHLKTGKEGGDMAGYSGAASCELWSVGISSRKVSMPPK